MLSPVCQSPHLRCDRLAGLDLVAFLLTSTLDDRLPSRPRATKAAARNSTGMTKLRSGENGRKYPRPAPTKLDAQPVADFLHVAAATRSDHARASSASSRKLIEWHWNIVSLCRHVLNTERVPIIQSQGFMQAYTKSRLPMPPQ